MSKILKAITEGVFFEKAWMHIKVGTINAGRRFMAMIRSLLFRWYKVDPKKIIFSSFDVRYSDNPRAISEEIIRRGLPVKMVWIVPHDPKANVDAFPTQAIKARKNTWNMFRQQAEAAVWVENSTLFAYYGIPKREGQTYINTWHGSLGIKKLDGGPWFKYCMDKANHMIDYLLVNSTFEEDVFGKSWFSNVRQLHYGHPRNDILFQKERHEEISRRCRQFYGIPEDAHLFLYAPTFRDDKNTDWLQIDVDRLHDTLVQQYGGEWYILMRHHIRTENANVAASPWVLDGNAIAEIYDLMIASDFGCTDYSSWAYEYIMLNRPLIIYAPDIEKYENLRGFYYSLYETPFPIARDNDELAEKIASFDQEEYERKVQEFLKEKGCYEQGNAASRTVDLIEQIMFKDK